MQGTMQNGAAPSGYAAQAPMKQYQVVQTPNPRRFDYASDLASGSPQAAAAYAKQVSCFRHPLLSPIMTRVYTI